MKPLRGTRAVITVLLTALMLLGPAISGIGAAAQDSGKVLRIHQLTFPDDVDPQKSSFANEIAILSLNYEGLTRQTSDLESVGAAAESWEFNDDLTVITFHLREDRQIVARARRIEQFMSQPYFTAEQFTGNPGRFVSLADTVRSFREITDGKYDHLPEALFRYKGSIDEVVEAAEKMEFENRKG